MEKMIIALDYDGTYTADPDLWLAFIHKARNRGHQVMIVTMRHEHENEAVERQLADKVDRIIYTGRKGKSRYMRFLGIAVDIWIDDQPGWIFEDLA